MPTRLLCLLALPLCCAAAEPDEDWIATDRPDFVDAPAVVGKGHVQLETGWLQARDREDGVRQRAGSTPWMLRIGLADDLELRLESDGRLSYRSGALRQRGWGDVALSGKWRAWEADGALPALGVIVQAGFATGSRAFRGNGTRPSARLPLEWELPHELTLGVMPGIVLERDERGRHAPAGQFGITLARAYGERAYTFVELAAPRIAHGRHGGSSASFDFGGGYSITRDMHVDAGVARGLNRRTPDVSFTVGLSVRM